MVCALSRKRGRSFRMASSKAIICAVSNSDPIGSTESVAPRSSAIVCAGIAVTTSTSLARPPFGCAVTSAVRAPAARAMPASVRAVARSPGPAETMKQIAGGDFRRRHVAPDRDVAAHMEQPHGEAAHLQALAAEAEHDDALGGDDLLDESVERVLRHGREYAIEVLQRSLGERAQ